MLAYLQKVTSNQSSIITTEPTAKPISRESVWMADQSNTRIGFNIIIIIMITIMDGRGG